MRKQFTVVAFLAAVAVVLAGCGAPEPEEAPQIREAPQEAPPAPTYELTEVAITEEEPNTDIDSNTVVGFTPGVQIFFGGRNKLALNYDFVSFGGDGVDSESSFKAQYQFHF
jgi:hypothetical protein